MTAHAPPAARPEHTERTIAERLGDYGIIQQRAAPDRHDGRRALGWGNHPLGLATAFEADALLNLLDDLSPFPSQTPDGLRNAVIGSGALAVVRRIVALIDSGSDCDEIAASLAEIAADGRQVIAAADGHQARVAEVAANARLHSAAPELLAALVGLTKLATRHPDLITDPRFDAAMLAVAKADAAAEALLREESDA